MVGKLIHVDVTSHDVIMASRDAKVKIITVLKTHTIAIVAHGRVVPRFEALIKVHLLLWLKLRHMTSSRRHVTPKSKLS